VVSALFLWLMLRQVDAGRVWRELRQLSLLRLALCLVPMAAALSMMTSRSLVLLAPMRRFHPLLLFKSVLVALAGNNLLPMRMGELLRVAYLARHGTLPYGTCLAVVGVERLLDLLCLALLFFCLLPVVVVPLPRAAVIVGLTAATGGALALLLGIARYPDRFAALVRALFRIAGQRAAGWIAAKVEPFARGLTCLSSPGRGIAALFFSLVFWCAQALTFFVFVWAFDLRLPWYAPGVVLIFIAFGVALPSSPAYVGTYHYFFQLALTLMGVEASRGASVAIVSHAASVVPITSLAAILLSHELFRRKPAQAAEVGEVAAPR
jgi:uncharacterized protein (TIRG00374 family)